MRDSEGILGRDKNHEISHSVKIRSQFGMAWSDVQNKTVSEDGVR
jgi:hypothetical protein